MAQRLGEGRRRGTQMQRCLAGLIETPARGERVAWEAEVIVGVEGTGMIVRAQARPRCPSPRATSRPAAVPPAVMRHSTTTGPSDTGAAPGP